MLALSVSSVLPCACRPPLSWFPGRLGAVVALLTGIALRYFYVIERWRGQVAAHARAEADAVQARIRRISCSTA